MNNHNTDTDYIAIDLAKDSLQVLSEQDGFNIKYDSDGLAKLLEFIQAHSKPAVICEATGGYERKLMQYLFDHDIAVALINPRRLRAFAISQGIKAKTDSIDAQMLLRFAQQHNPRICLPTDPNTQKLIDLLNRRHQLTDMLADEKNRLQKAPVLTQHSIEKHILFLKEQIKQAEQATEQIIDSNEQLKQQAKVIESVVGIGKTTAWHIMAHLREITTLSRNQIVALVGLAPYNRDSGAYTGKRFIQGGRHKVRTCLYMAAQSAAVHNQVIRQYVQGLRERGKSYKSSMVVAMRKLIIHIQSLLRSALIS